MAKTNMTESSQYIEGLRMFCLGLSGFGKFSDFAQTAQNLPFPFRMRKDVPEPDKKKRSHDVTVTPALKDLTIDKKSAKRGGVPEGDGETNRW